MRTRSGPVAQVFPLHRAFNLCSVDTVIQIRRYVAVIHSCFTYFVAKLSKGPEVKCLNVVEKFHPQVRYYINEDAKNALFNFRTNNST